jgi:hypothetical protein
MDPSTLIPDMFAAMNLTLNLAEQYNVPVYYQVDDMNNLMPPNSPVTAETLYSNDPNMVEWTTWPQGGASAAIFTYRMWY